VANFEFNEYRIDDVSENAWPSGSGNDASLFFNHLQQAGDVLLDPAKRFAYDRFGPTILQWKHCVTIRDYLQTAGSHSVILYVGGAFFLALSNFLGYLESGKYWRFLTIACLVVFEAYTVTRTTWPGILTHIINPIFVKFKIGHPYLPFEAISFARKLTLTIFIALAQVTPLIKGPLQTSDESAHLQQLLDRLDALAKHTDQEAGRLLGLELTPFASDETTEQEVKQQLRSWIVQNTIRSNQEVRDAMGRALQRRRQDAPAGAKGTR